jgi:hypothetical protein
MNAFELTREIRLTNEEIERFFEETQGEITDCVDDLLARMEDLEASADAKVHAITHVHEGLVEHDIMLEAIETHLKGRLDTIKARRKAFANNQTRLKDSLINLMDALGRDSYEFEGRKISVGKTKALLVLNEELAIANLPDQFLRIKREIDKTALKKHIDSTGVSYEGVDLVTNKHIKGL